MQKAKFQTFLNVWVAVISLGYFLTANSQAKAVEGSLKVDTPMEKFVKKEIAGGGTISLIDANTKQLVGVSNWDGNKLNDYQNLLFDQIRIGYATNAASGKEGELDYKTALPLPLLNAEFVLKQNGKELFRLPVSAVNNNQVNATLSDFYYDLGVIKTLTDSTAVEMELQFPTGVVLDGAVKHYVYVGLNGYATKLG